MGSPLTPRSTATRAFDFDVGGMLQVNANQAEGLYAADFDLTAQYL